jgi:hypothetical protein
MSIKTRQWAVIAIVFIGIWISFTKAVHHTERTSVVKGSNYRQLSVTKQRTITNELLKIQKQLNIYIDEMVSDLQQQGFTDAEIDDIRETTIDMLTDARDDQGVPFNNEQLEVLFRTVQNKINDSIQAVMISKNGVGVMHDDILTRHMGRPSSKFSLLQVQRDQLHQMQESDDQFPERRPFLVHQGISQEGK